MEEIPWTLWCRKAIWTLWCRIFSPPPPKAQKSPKPAGAEDLQARLAAQEAENLALREEVEKLQEQVAELQDRLAKAEPRWVTLQRLGGS